MGMREARKYISDLHKKQKNPYLWPDYLTGLPDIGAILKKVDDVYPRLGKFSIHYIRIANIHPYLIKYGPDRHSEIIQWAAALLKAAADRRKGFVGAIGRHDFVAVCLSDDAEAFFKDASNNFQKKTMTFYSSDDLKKKHVLSFDRNGKNVNIGFMKLISSSITEKTEIPKERIIQHLNGLCSKIEKEYS